jgi:predicted transcriptional regulator
MSHSLHRRGCKESLKDDFVILITPSVGINHENSGPMLWKILDIITDVGPNNIGSYETGTIYTGVTIEQIKESMPETPRVRCCFDSKEKMLEVLKRIKELDAGLSVTISGINEDVLEMANKLDIKAHSINYSLGIFGRTELLPPEEVMEFITMCGHGMISKDLVIKTINDVRKGKKTLRDAAKIIAQPCVCGIFNVDRAEKLLSKYVSRQV